MFVLGTGTNKINARNFSWKHGVKYFGPPGSFPPHHISRFMKHGFAYVSLFMLGLESNYKDILAFSVIPSLLIVVQ